MELNDTSTGWTPPPQPPRDRAWSGPRRMAATILLAIGLMAAGGVAIVSAASPDPNPARTHDCPNMPGASATPSG